MIQEILFFIFAGIAGLSGLMVVSQRNPVRAALFLVLAFFASAGIWLLAHAEFLALVLILVYVGAVMTLFLFVVMMLNVDIATLKHHFVKSLPLGVLIVGLLVLLMLIAIAPEHFGQPAADRLSVTVAHYSNVKELGAVLYTRYAYPFELAAVLLLVAIIASICLAHQRPRNCKTQCIADQVKVKRSDRIKLVSGVSEDG